MDERATVVIVDSNPAVLDLCEQALRDAGHWVLVTTESSEALALVNTVQVDLVVAGSAQLEPFRARRDSPQLLAIRDPGEPRVSPALRRPFTLAQLQDAVALALGISDSWDVRRAG